MHHERANGVLREFQKNRSRPEEFSSRRAGWPLSLNALISPSGFDQIHRPLTTPASNPHLKSNFQAVFSIKPTDMIQIPHAGVLRNLNRIYGEPK